MAANGATTIWELWNEATTDPAMVPAASSTIMLLNLISSLLLSTSGLGIKECSSVSRKSDETWLSGHFGRVGFIRASHITLWQVTSNWSEATGKFLGNPCTCNGTALLTYGLPNAEITSPSPKQAIEAIPKVYKYSARKTDTVCKIGSGKYNFQIKKNISYGKGRKGLLEDGFICRKPSP